MIEDPEPRQKKTPVENNNVVEDRKELNGRKDREDVSVIEAVSCGHLCIQFGKVLRSHMPARTFLLERRVEILDGSLVFPRVLADLPHDVRLVAHLVAHCAFRRRCRVRGGVCSGSRSWTD